MGWDGKKHSLWQTGASGKGGGGQASGKGPDAAAAVSLAAWAERG